MKINVHAGHNPDGKVACGAVGLIYESTEVLVYNKATKAYGYAEKVCMEISKLGYKNRGVKVNQGLSFFLRDFLKLHNHFDKSLEQFKEIRIKA